MTVQSLTQNQNGLMSKFRLTIQQYHLMHEVGVFQEGDRLELINGEITTMFSIGRKHATCVARLNAIFTCLLFQM